MLALVTGPVEKKPSKNVMKMMVSLLGSLVHLATAPYGRLDEVGRMAIIYGILVLATTRAGLVCRDEDAVKSIASFLSTLALSGVVQWDEPGWLDDVVASSDPLRLAASHARCHAAVVEEAQRTRRRAHRLMRLVETDPAALTAALRWKAKHHTSHTHHGDDEGGLEASDDCSMGSASACSLPASLATLATEEGGDSGDRQLERTNLFSPAALRHGALAALAIVHAHCRHKGSPGLKAAFAASGGFDCVLVVGYHSFSEDFVMQHSEKEAVSTGLLGLRHHDHDREAERSVAESTKSAASSAESLRVAYQASQATLEAQALAVKMEYSRTLPTLAAQARAHLDPAALLARAGGPALSEGQVGNGVPRPQSGGGAVGSSASSSRGEAGRVRLVAELQGDWRARVLSWRTGQLSEALLAQLDGGAASQMQRARIAMRAAWANKKPPTKTRFGAAVPDPGDDPGDDPGEATRHKSSSPASTSSGGTLPARPPPAAPLEQEWNHPFRLLEGWSRSDTKSVGLLAALRSPASPHFALVDAPLNDLVRERFASDAAAARSDKDGRPGTRGGDAVGLALRKDARSARDASMDKGLGLRDRLAAAVAGARIESVAEVRASAVAQQAALGVLGRSAGLASLVSMGAGEADLARRLTAQVVVLADARARAEAKASTKATSKMSFKKNGDEDADDDDDDDDDDNGSLGDNVSMLSGATVGSSATSQARRLKKRRAAEAAAAAAALAAEAVISLEDFRKGKVGRLETEVERRVRVALEAKYALLNREAILEAREALEIERLRMINEDKRSKRLTEHTNLQFATATMAAQAAAAAAALKQARVIGEEQRKGKTDLDAAARPHFDALAAEDREKEAARKVEAKRIKFEESIRRTDMLARMAKEKAVRERAADEEAAAAAFKQRRKAEAVALKAAVRAWRKAKDLHERTGVAYAAKVKAMGRLKGGGFKLVDGELRWRDEDTSVPGYWPAGDPRHAKDSHPVLKSLLTLGSVKPWRWAEADMPLPPEGMENADTPPPEPSDEDDEGAVIVRAFHARTAHGSVVSTEPSALTRD